MTTSRNNSPQLTTHHLADPLISSHQKSPSSIISIPQDTEPSQPFRNRFGSAVAPQETLTSYASLTNKQPDDLTKYRKNSKAWQKWLILGVCVSVIGTTLLWLYLNPQRQSKEVSPKFNGNVDNITTFSITPQRSLVQANTLKEQTMPILVSLGVEDLAAFHRASVDLVCVLDHSGSMAGEKITLLKNTFKYMLNYLDANDRISIVLFNHHASTLVSLVNATEANKEEILSKIQTIKSGGGTDITAGIDSALKQLLAREKINQVTGVLLLSDGLNSAAKEGVNKTLAQSGLQNNITLHAIGFGNDYDPDLMISIADLTDGSFYAISDLHRIDEALVECIGTLQSTISGVTEITITPEQPEILKGVEIVKAYGDATMWTQRNNTFSTKTSNLIMGKHKDYVLELKLPVLLDEKKLSEKRAIDIKVGSVEAVITYFNGSQIVKKDDLIITLVDKTVDVTSDIEDDKNVTLNFYRVKSALLMKEATILAEEKKYSEAIRLLDQFAAELESSPWRYESTLRNLIFDVERAAGYSRESVYEEMGRNNLLSNSRAQMRQLNNLDLSSVHLTNTHLSKSVFALADMKNSR